VIFHLCLLSGIVLLAGCSKAGTNKPEVTRSLDSVDACRIALAPTPAPDQKLSELQAKARINADERSLDALGWAFIEKARTAYDPGYYKIAESCAACLETRSPGNPSALLLRGHALDSLHRFSEAEAIARQLVSVRGLYLDYELLGDALMEQGKMSEAVAAYQSMMDLKPGPEAYSRAAHMRWLTGDLDGAIEMMTLAARGAGSGEPAAWAETRLAVYLLQTGSLKLALAACHEALNLQPNYAPALLAKSRILLVQGQVDDALAILRTATRLNPLPDYQWALAEALRAARQDKEVEVTETQIAERGAETDPRTVALFLATRQLKPETALTLARKEFENRQDAYTRDTLAWTLYAAGQFAEAHQMMQQVMAVGTLDARFFLHAGLIAAKCGDKREARNYYRRATSIKQMLLPTEREILAKQLTAL
jgi:tetratricopeptide (TPR) repeat protein